MRPSRPRSSAAARAPRSWGCARPEMFADFISCAWDQLVTVAAKQFYRAGTPVPIVVRLLGRRLLGRPFHSQNPESFVCAHRGPEGRLPGDARGRQGLADQRDHDPNPVLYFEHKHLYRRIKAEVPEERYTTPFGKARSTARARTSTVVTWEPRSTRPPRPRSSSSRTTSRSRSSTYGRSSPGTGRRCWTAPRRRRRCSSCTRTHAPAGFWGEIVMTIAEEAFDADADQADRRARHAGAVRRCSRRRCSSHRSTT